MHLRDSLIPKYSELVYGFWFSPEREALQVGMLVGTEVWSPAPRHRARVPFDRHKTNQIGIVHRNAFNETRNPRPRQNRVSLVPVGSDPDEPWMRIRL
jgi:hypothetical protein